MTQAEVQALITKYGPPGYENSKGALSKLNKNFWAAYYAREKEKIIFEPNEREFYDYHGLTGVFDPKSADVIRTELSAQIMDAANSDWHNALQLVTEEDWVFIVRKTAEDFQFEASFHGPAVGI